MSMEERIWALDKNEASLLRSYFTEISTCHEEIDVIVAKKWEGGGGTVDFSPLCEVYSHFETFSLSVYLVCLYVQVEYRWIL